MAPDTPRPEPTETSPLLGAPQGAAVDAGDGSAPGGPEDASLPSIEPNSDPGDIEQHARNGELSKAQGLPMVRARLKWIFPAIAIGVFLSAADQTLIVSTYGIIGTDLGALSATSWIATAYFLTLTACQPLYGRLSDVFGRKECLLFGYVVFGIGCVACGFARTIGELIAARAFAGIGGGGMTVCVSILLSDVVSLRDRGTWQGYINLVYASGAAAGAPLGGLLAETIGWRWSFMAQGPLCLVAVVAVGVALQLPKQEAAHWKQKLARIDFLGALVLILAIFGLLVGLDRGSNEGWSKPLAIAGLCSTPLFAVFVLVEKYVAKHPFAPGHIILDRSLVACYLCNFFSFSGWLAAIFFIPLYWQVTYGYGASQAGLLLMPSIVSGVSGSLVGGVYMKRTAKYYWITVVAYSNLTIGLSLILLFAGTLVRNLPLMVVGTCICGFSNGIGVTTTLIGLSPSPPPRPFCMPRS
ncbi:MFS general substrate transporter [Didymella exigua CBS 183.55]|uniref:MFS general substrate transporter n=1 Tax=Didymella exigua CBS 183.55 TaxID=1150837 RepID=A0A6A5S647_9PLEO|nr:MFS general substrate transporter [Didymella exigua CBS 183.55]KAF1933976.1 MFS general substrate transporter [Didymella exigua CBS 183.55]